MKKHTHVETALNTCLKEMRRNRSSLPDRPCMATPQENAMCCNFFPWPPSSRMKTCVCLPFAARQLAPQKAQDRELRNGHHSLREPHKYWYQAPGSNPMGTPPRSHGCSSSKPWRGTNHDLADPEQAPTWAIARLEVHRDATAIVRCSSLPKLTSCERSKGPNSPSSRMVPSTTAEPRKFHLRRRAKPEDRAG